MEVQTQFEVIIVKYGTRSTCKSEVYLNFAVYGKEDQPIDMDYFFWVIRNPGRTVLVDTGFSFRGGQLRNRSSLITPVDACKELGIAPESVGEIIVTHAHYDHVGNLRHFPNAEVIIAEKEYRFWTGKFAARAQFRHSIEDEEIDYLREVQREGRLRLWNDRLELVEGISLIEVGGHTPGQAAVLVQTADGPTLLASDCIHYYEEFEDDMPFAFVGDLAGMYQGFDTIRGLIDSGEVTHLVAGHDPSTLSRFPPVQGKLENLVAIIGGDRV